MRPSARFLLLSSLLLATLSLGRHTAAAGPATKITVTPAAATVIAGQSQTLTVTATAADGTTSDVTSQSTLSADDPRGTFAGAVYTAGKAGTWTILASYQSLTTTTTVTVTPGAVQELTINPNSEPELTYLAKTAIFSVVAYDAFNNVISNQAVTWSVIGDIGTINDKGVFTPTKIGTGKIQATAGTITGQVSVVAQAAPVVNTNTAATNVNTVKNTNTTNQNTNTAVTNTATTNTATTTDECVTLKPWAWTLMLIIFMLVVVVFYALIPVTKIWPVVVALIAAAVLAYVQRKYGCGTQPWWAWVMTLGTIAISAVANTMRPKSTPTV